MNLPPADWDNQRTFLAIMREGSLSAAARSLNVSQPTARRHIESLEQCLGQKLFNRTSTGLIPTETARALFPHALEMATAADAFVRAACADIGSAKDTVRIATSELLGVEILPQRLEPLRLHYPELVLELSLGSKIEGLTCQEADIAVRTLRPKALPVIAQRAGYCEVGLFATEDYIERHGMPQSLGALAFHALIGPDRNTHDVQVLREQGVDFEPHQYRLRTDSHLAQLAAIRSGLGIGACHEPIARQSGLVRVLAQEFSYPLEFWLVMHEDLRNTQRVRVVFDHLLNTLRQYLAE
ncbi:LysR family transcriptional regulator [Yersinia sp. 1252 StPb PI]|uniref:LysR family transcriptional regulator n=1 Tax=Yersinia sp. 1252 StPb PI TaxID=3117404 RepID=UPI003B28DC81